MVYTFEYTVNGQVTFRANLRGQRCIGHRRDGQRCARRSVIGCPYCFQHLRSDHIYESNHPQYPMQEKDCMQKIPLKHKTLLYLEEVMISLNILEKTSLDNNLTNDIKYIQHLMRYKCEEMIIATVHYILTLH